MDPLTILAVAGQVLRALPDLTELGADVYNLVTRTADIVENPATATQADVDATLAAIDALTKELNKDPPAA